MHIACSQTTPFIFNYHKRVEVVIFHVLLLFLQVSTVIQQKLHVKSCILANTMKCFVEREKKFCEDSGTLKLHSKTSLGAGLSVESNVMVIRCMNQFLLRQT